MSALIGLIKSKVGEKQMIRIKKKCDARHRIGKCGKNRKSRRHLCGAVDEPKAVVNDAEFSIGIHFSQFNP